MAADEMKGPGTGAEGFSLLELLAAMAILAVLASIALPTYAEYVARSRRFEARAGLLEAAHWMERWRTERGRYDDLENAGQPPTEFPWSQFPRTGDANYTVSVLATAVTYRITATATRTMASDVCKSLSIDETGVRGFSGSGSTEEVCWRR
jgi:type IV pilus assembly protein PilE